MKRSITGLALTIGSAALLAFSSGCSKDNRPAQSAVEASPTFESNVPQSGMGTTGSPSDQSGLGQSGQGQPGQLGTQDPSGYGQSGQYTQPGQPGQQGMQGQQGTMQGQSGQVHGQSGQSGAAATMSDREACDALGRDTKMTVEDVQGGVAIVLRPKTGTDLSTLRDNARMFERHMNQSISASGRSGQQGQPGQSGYSGAGADQCALFSSINSIQGANAVVTEGTDSVRILITTSQTGQVQTLRRHVRDFANTSGQSGQKNPGGGQQKGNQGGQQPQQ